jgi:hypothetical protein
MSQQTPTVPPGQGVERSDHTLRQLLRIGGLAALGCAVVYLLAYGIHIAAMRAGPLPATALEWLALLQSNTMRGLFFLGLDAIVIMILWIPMTLALHAALKRCNPTWALVGAAFAFVGIAVYLATNAPFFMLSLSRQYAMATAEAERSILLAAAEATLAMHSGTGAQHSGMPLAWLGGLMLSGVMLRSPLFSRDTAWSGILGMGLSLASIPVARSAPTWPPTLFVTGVVAFVYAGGGVLSWAWYVALGWSLLRAGQAEGKAPSQQQR